jgi:molybdate transport system substrate-binding protein
MRIMRQMLLAAIIATGAILPARADILVFAASSLKTALDLVAQDWQAQTGQGVVVAYGGSAALAKQIQSGAPADIYISAAQNWMDVLQQDGLIAPATRRDILGNSLVLIAHGAGSPPVALTQGVDLVPLLRGGVLAMGNVTSVPAGQYGREALESLGIWAQIAPHVAQVENVAMARALVASGDAPLGIVYASDAAFVDQSAQDVTVVARFDARLHSPIAYPAALTASANPQAAAFLEHLSTPAARAIFIAHGFAPPLQ